MVRRAVLVLWMLALATAAQAQTGSIGGRVIDAATGQPLGSSDTVAFFVSLRDSAGRNQASQPTDAAGRYSFPNLSPGSYTLYTSASSGLVNVTSDGTACIAVCEPTRPVVVAAGSSVTVDFVLPRSATIGGRVADAVTRAPVANAGVILYDARRRTVAFAVSDAAGRYVFSNAIAGSTYFVVVTPPQPYASQAYAGIPCADGCRLLDATPIRVATSQTIGGIDVLVTRPTGTISGRVAEATGAGVAGAVVSAALRPGNEFTFTATADASGNYTITGLPDGVYGVFASGGGLVPQAYDGISGCCGDELTGTPVTIASGVPVTGINFRLAVQAGFSGRVTRAGANASDAVVTVFDSSGRVIRSVAGDATGAYAIGSLQAGTYFATANAFLSLTGLYRSVPCQYSGCVPTTGTPITVAAGVITTGVDIDLVGRGARVTGAVTSNTGAPLASAFVHLFRGETSVDGGFTAADGTYNITNVTPGTYRVRASADGFVDEWYGNACVLCGEHGTSVTVAPDATVSGVNLSLDPAGTITGAIAFVGQARAGFVGVDALRADGSVVANGLSVPFTDGTRYTIRGLPAGTYFVRALSHVQFAPRFAFGGEFAPALYQDKECATEDCPLTNATPVTVAAGATTSGIDLTMHSGATISGRVQAEGKFVDLPRAFRFSPRVQAYTEDGRVAGSFLIHDVEGNYSIVGLAPGRYFVRAFASGYAEQLYKNLSCSGCAPQRGTPIVVTEAEVRRGIDFTLFPAGSIAGSVHDAAGAPIPNVTVSAYDEGGSFPNGRVSVFPFATTTDRLGHYVLSGLGAGRYYIATTNLQGFADEVFDNVACGSCDPLRGRTVVVTGGAETPGIDFELARGVLLTGTVNDETGSGAGFTTVNVFNAAGQAVARVQATFDGAYTVSAPAGTNYARADARTGYGAELYQDVPCPGGVCDPTSGTPIVGTAGQILRGLDFSVPVCGLTSLQPSALPVGVVGASYATSVTASGSSGGFTYTVQGGRLPPGLSIDPSTGAISGTPTATGRFTFTVGAATPNGCGGSRSYVIDVNGCTPSIAPGPLGTATFDIPGSGGSFFERVDASCAAAVAINASWLTSSPTAPGSGDGIEIVVAPNRGGPRTGTITLGNRTVTVNQGSAAASAPFGTVDIPVEGSIVSGSIAIGGWVLDDLRASRVEIYRSPVAGEGGAFVFVGLATLVPGARPDVESLFPEYPYANRAGFGYLLLTNVLPAQGNGTFTLVAIAEDVEGHRVTLGSRTIVANNASATLPFGAIDTPDQGETIFGSSFTHFGWALTPRPKTIPKDGSTISVVIDGASAGSVTYNQFRPDVAGLFPGLNNTNGAIGYRLLDTTTLADGIHTIAWVVTDDAGAGEGIGSRYFTVANAAALTSAVTEPPPPLIAAPARAAARVFEIRELELLEIPLAENEPSSCRAVFRGVERVGTEQRPLPVGSSLDLERGVFRWQPGPGFAGRYALSFDVGSCDGSVTRLDVEVRISGPIK